MTGFVPDPGQPDISTTGFVPAPGIGAGLAAGGMFEGGGSLSGDAIAAAKESTAELVKSAASGGFKITETGVRPLLDAIRGMKSDVQTMRQSMYTLSQAPMLGSHAYGQAVAEHDQKAGADVKGSASMVLDQFGEVLDQAEAALRKASGVYEGQEQAVEDTIKKLQV